MKNTGADIIENFIVIALIFGVIQMIPGVLYAQQLHAPADSTLASGLPTTLKNSFNTSSPSLYSVKGASNSYKSSMRSIGEYRLNLTRGLSILGGLEGVHTGSYLSSGNMSSMMGGNGMDGMTSGSPGNFRRADLGIRQVRLDMQHFTLGASYNYGLNNLLRESPVNARNPGVSLHAGFSF